MKAVYRWIIIAVLGAGGTTIYYSQKEDVVTIVPDGSIAVDFCRVTKPGTSIHSKGDLVAIAEHGHEWSKCELGEEPANEKLDLWFGVATVIMTIEEYDKIKYYAQYVEADDFENPTKLSVKEGMPIPIPKGDDPE